MNDEKLIEMLETAAAAWSAESYLRSHDINGPGSPKEHSVMWVAAQRLREWGSAHAELQKAAQAVVDLDEGGPDLWHYDTEFGALRAVLAKNPKPSDEVSQPCAGAGRAARGVALEGAGPHRCHNGMGGVLCEICGADRHLEGWRA